MKVAIFGAAGGVGSAVAFNLLLSGGAFDVVLVDVRPHLLTSHLMDLREIVGLTGARAVRAGTAADARDADVVVLCASVPPRPDAPRSAYLHDNAAVVREIVDPLVASGWHGILFMVTNPVDALVTWVQHRTGLDRRRVIGYCLNDTLRLRTGVAQVLDLHPNRVDAWVLGQHGEAQVPLYSRIRVDGRTVALTDDQRRAVDQYIGTWFARHEALRAGRSSTWASGLGVARMVHAMASAAAQPWPASVTLDGEYGIRGVGLGVPAVLDRTGVRMVHDWPLNAEESAGLIGAAERIRAAADQLTVRDATTADP
jgi:malate dehydrogenase